MVIQVTQQYGCSSHPHMNEKAIQGKTNNIDIVTKHILFIKNSIKNKQYQYSSFFTFFKIKIRRN
jgi:hypothetical protein